MDPTVTAAIISATAMPLGALAGWAASRSTRHAEVELTEAQTQDLQTRVSDQVIGWYREINQELESKVTELENEVTELRTQLLEREQELRGERDAARAEIVELRAALATKEAELAAAQAEIEHLKSAMVTQAQVLPPAA